MGLRQWAWMASEEQWNQMIEGRQPSLECRPQRLENARFADHGMDAILLVLCLIAGCFLLGAMLFLK